MTAHNQETAHECQKTEIHTLVNEIRLWCDLYFLECRLTAQQSSNRSLWYPLVPIGNHHWVQFSFAASGRRCLTGWDHRQLRSGLADRCAHRFLHNNRIAQHRTGKDHYEQDCCEKPPRVPKNLNHHGDCDVACVAEQVMYWAFLRKPVMEHPPR